ncbi:hypothetical protein D3C75_892250 [compost metagenome]
MDAEQGGAGCLNPEDHRWFIHRYKSAGIKGPVEKIVKALQHTGYSSCVIRIGILFIPDAVPVQERRKQGDQRQRNIQFGFAKPLHAVRRLSLTDFWYNCVA